MVAPTEMLKLTLVVSCIFSERMAETIWVRFSGGGAAVAEVAALPVVVVDLLSVDWALLVPLFVLSLDWASFTLSLPMPSLDWAAFTLSLLRPSLDWASLTLSLPMPSLDWAPFTLSLPRPSLDWAPFTVSLPMPSLD